MTGTEAKSRHDLSFAQSGAKYNQRTIEAVYEGFRAAGIDFVVFMPDATLDGIEQRIWARWRL